MAQPMEAVKYAMNMPKETHESLPFTNETADFRPLETLV
jgi:hypothetical protein